jgi:two-component system, OmpR family, phosphate regulon response regulator PhoB
MARILVIEDERDIQDVLAYNLRQAGHEVFVAGRAREGLSLARQHRPELVILDLMLPDQSGTEVCKELKREATTRDAAVIMLTAKGEEIDRIVGFEVGAEDYVVKPFSTRELMLRVQAVLGRSRRAAAAETRGRESFGVLTIDLDAHRVFVAGAEIELTALEFKLLATLHERKDRVQSREALLADVWDIKADINTRTVDTHVKRLREKLGQAGEYIDTVRGVGYRFKNEP